MTVNKWHIIPPQGTGVPYSNKVIKGDHPYFIMSLLTNQFCVIEPSTSEVLKKFKTFDKALDFAQDAFRSTGYKVVCQLDLDADNDGSRAWNVVKHVCFVKV